MKSIRKSLLTALLAALLTVSCFAQEVFHAAYLRGFPDGTLRPGQSVTRAELAEILYRLMEPEAREEASSAECGFLDLGPSHWAYDAVSALARLRIMLGFADGYFRPERGVTGPELSIVLERIRASEAGRTAWPALASGWDAEDVTFAAGNGWVMGLFDGVFQKDRAFTRSWPGTGSAFRSSHRNAAVFGQSRHGERKLSCHAGGRRRPHGRGNKWP